MKMRAALLAGMAMWAIGARPAAAVQPSEKLPDPGLESRARRISAELRCLVCQNQSIDDSDAPLAQDLRVLVRDRLKAGDDDAAVRGFIVSRYGEYVLLKPVLASHTIVLWLAPPAILLAGFVGLVLTRRRRMLVEARLSDEEQRRVDAVLRRAE